MEMDQGPPAAANESDGVNKVAQLEAALHQPWTALNDDPALPATFAVRHGSIVFGNDDLDLDAARGKTRREFQHKSRSAAGAADKPDKQYINSMIRCALHRYHPVRRQVSSSIR